jgi:hypothetical protein
LEFNIEVNQYSEKCVEKWNQAGCDEGNL